MFCLLAGGGGLSLGFGGGVLVGGFCPGGFWYFFLFGGFLGDGFGGGVLEGGFCFFWRGRGGGEGWQDFFCFRGGFDQGGFECGRFCLGGLVQSGIV